MDRLTQLARGRGWLIGLLGFLGFSFAVFLVGWLLGVYGYDPADEGGIEMRYRPPTGERRF